MMDYIHIFCAKHRPPRYRFFVAVESKTQPYSKSIVERGLLIWPQITVVLPRCSIKTCMHIISLYRSITNQTNLVSKKHFERISFFKQHVARLRLPPLKVKLQVFEYHRKIDPIMREKLCKQTLTTYILTYKIHQNAQDSPISCSL